jgi:hypothetical protein
LDVLFHFAKEIGFYKEKSLNQMLDMTSKKYLPIGKSVEALSNVLNHSKQIIEFLGNGWTNSQNG